MLQKKKNYPNTKQPNFGFYEFQGNLLKSIAIRAIM